jgi:hypothetical protein
MRKFFLTLLLAISLLPSLAMAANVQEVNIPGSKKCFWDKDRPGILVDYAVVTPSTKAEQESADTLLNCYLRVALRNNSALIVTVAVIIVVFSGIQYMLALGNSGNQAKAKQRIVAVITGVIFYTLITFFVTIIGAG